MNKQFKLSVLTTQRIVLMAVLIFSGLALVIIASVKFADLLVDFSPIIRRGCVMLSLGVGGYGLYRMVQRIGGVPIIVTITPEHILVLRHRTGEQQVPFEDIAAYRYQDFNGNADLRLKFRDGSRLRLAISSRFQDDKSFKGMVRAFEQSLGSYQHKHGVPAGSLRERTFFEKPISTIVLAGLLLAVFILISTVVSNDKPVKWGSLLTVLGSVFTYVAAWLAASEKRR